MNLTIEKDGILYLNPLSLEFWRLLPDWIKYVGMDYKRIWYGYSNDDVPEILSNVWVSSGSCAEITMNIHHPGTWEDSLYVRPELANENTPEGTLIITWNMIDNCYYTRGYLKDWHYNINPIIATEQIKLQYLGREQI